VGIDQTAVIHPLALVENSTIGKRTRVWQFASVIRGAILGDDCNVASTATLDGPRFGHRCIISQGCAIGPGFLVGDDVFIGPNVTFCNDMWPTTSRTGFDQEALQNGRWTIIVGNNVAIGANSVILPGITIGHYAMIAAGVTVTENVPEDHILCRDGNMAKIDPKWRSRRMRFADFGAFEPRRHRA
jgi:UDP-3-O-[3-hydroxymyristoyl] glucosamine N-acyltransferase